MMWKSFDIYMNMYDIDITPKNHSQVINNMTPVSIMYSDDFIHNGETYIMFNRKTQKIFGIKFVAIQPMFNDNTPLYIYQTQAYSVSCVYKYVTFMSHLPKRIKLIPKEASADILERFYE